MLDEDVGTTQIDGLASVHVRTEVARLYRSYPIRRYLIRIMLALGILASGTGLAGAYICFQAPVYNSSLESMMAGAGVIYEEDPGFFADSWRWFANMSSHALTEADEIERQVVAQRTITASFLFLFSALLWILMFYIGRLLRIDRQWLRAIKPMGKEEE